MTNEAKRNEDTVEPLVLPSVLGDSLAELNRLRDSITASMGIPAHLLRCDPPLHPTYSEYQATARAEWRRQNAPLQTAERSGASLQAEVRR